MSKTGFLPPRSSQATEGDRHRNKHKTVWRVYRSLHKVPRGNRVGNKFCPGRVRHLRAQTLHTRAECDNTERQGEQYEHSIVVGKDAGLENGKWTCVAARRGAWDGHWAVEDEAGMPSWPKTMRGLNSQLRHFEDDKRTTEGF